MRSLLFIAIVFLSLQVIADEEIRPGPHNKMGLSKMDPNEKKDTFFYKLFNDELDLTGSNNNQNFTDSNTQILSQIEKLADLRDRGVITEDEFSDKKSILLDKIR